MLYSLHLYYRNYRFLYNLNGYYDHLRLQLRHMVDMGLSAPERLENIHFAASLQEIKDIAASAE